MSVVTASLPMGAPKTNPDNTYASQSESPAGATVDELRLEIQQAPGSPSSMPSTSCTYSKYFNFIRQVGDGTFARTWLAIDKRTNQRVLAKLLRRTDSNRSHFEREWRLSRIFSRHPNIIHTYPEAYENDEHRMLIQEYADGGDLCSAIKSGVGLSQVRARRYLGQIASALHHIHTCGYVHRDIKPENVVLANAPYEDDSYRKQLGLTMTHAKLIDFGLACKIGTEVTPAKITIPYLPPEVCAGHDSLAGMSTVVASPSQDVWSLGVTLFTMLTGMFPWKHAHKDDRNYAAFVHWQEAEPEWVPLMFGRFSWQLLELFRKLLAIDPEKRCNAAQALHYLDEPWFSCAGDANTSPVAVKTASRSAHQPRQTTLSDMRAKGLSVDSGISDASLLSCDSAALED